MSIESQRKLVILLVRKTDNRSIDWEATASENSFQTKIGENFVQIEEIQRRNNRDVQVSLLNKLGDIVDKFTDVDIENRDDPSESPYYTILSKLLGDARRNATGADKILDKIIDDLENDIPF